MLGLDNQTTESVQLMKDFILTADLFDVQVTVQTAFPGTPLYARLQAENRLKSEGDWRMCTLFDLNIVPLKMSETELLQSYYDLLGSIHCEQATTSRRKRFNDSLRQRMKGRRWLNEKLPAAVGEMRPAPVAHSYVYRKR